MSARYENFGSVFSGSLLTVTSHQKFFIVIEVKRSFVLEKGFHPFHYFCGGDTFKHILSKICSSWISEGKPS